MLRRAVTNMFFKTILWILLAQLCHEAIARLFSHDARSANCRHSLVCFYQRFHLWYIWQKVVVAINNNFVRCGLVAPPHGASPAPFRRR